MRLTVHAQFRPPRAGAFALLSNLTPPLRRQEVRVGVQREVAVVPMLLDRTNHQTMNECVGNAVKTFFFYLGVYKRDISL